jgi:hypothetical protein
VALSFSATAPASAPSVSSVKRIPQTIGVTLTPIVYLSFTPSSNSTLPSTPAFAFTLAPGFAFQSSSVLTYVAMLDPTSSSGWINLVGPGSASAGGVYSFASSPVPMTFKAGVTYVFAWYSTLAVVAPLPAPTPSPSPTPLVGNGIPLTGPTSGPSSIGRSWGPAAVANALQFPVQSGFNGSGITIAVVIDSNVFASDIAQYLSFFQVTETNQIAVRLLGGASASPTSGVQEATLDVETIAALAPGAKIVLYVMPALTTANFNNALAQVQQDGLASIINFSVSACENAGTSPATSSIIAQLAPTITVVAATGDTGSACFSGTGSGGQHILLTGTGYPASDPNVIGVGGTETGNQSGTTSLASTIAWNDNLAAGAQQEATGGGISSLFALPAYQAGLSGAASSQFRNVPDIAMPAVYTATYVNSQWTRVNGTSWGAPQFAAMLSEIYQFCNKTSFSGAVSLSYTAFSRSQYSAFIDVLSGNNAFSLTSGSTPAYTAQVGYDNAGGIGVPLGMPLANALCPNRIASATSRSLSQAAVTQQARATAYAVDVTPKAVGLTDIGRRAAGDSTHFQLVISSLGSATNNEQNAITVLRNAGFTIDQTFSNHLVVDASGPSAAIETLFSTEVDNVVQPKSEPAYMPAKPIIVPGTLAPYVAGVVLDNVVTFSRRGI